MEKNSKRACWLLFTRYTVRLCRLWLALRLWVLTPNRYQFILLDSGWKSFYRPGKRRYMKLQKVWKAVVWKVAKLAKQIRGNSSNHSNQTLNETAQKKKTFSYLFHILKSTIVTFRKLVIFSSFATFISENYKISNYSYISFNVRKTYVSFNVHLFTCWSLNKVASDAA